MYFCPVNFNVWILLNAISNKNIWIISLTYLKQRINTMTTNKWKLTQKIWRVALNQVQKHFRIKIQIRNMFNHGKYITFVFNEKMQQNLEPILHNVNKFDGFRAKSYKLLIHCLLVKIMEWIGVFRTQSNIYNGAFSVK